jgi:hypothetical protein
MLAQRIVEGNAGREIAAGVECARAAVAEKKRETKYGKFASLVLPSHRGCGMVAMGIP